MNEIDEEFVQHMSSAQLIIEMVNSNILKRKTGLDQEPSKKPRMQIQKDADDNSRTEVEQPFVETSDVTDEMLAHAREILDMLGLLSPSQKMISEHEPREKLIVEEKAADATSSVKRSTTLTIGADFDQVLPDFDQVLSDCATTSVQEPLLFTSDGLVRLFVDTTARTPAREHFTVTTDRNHIPVICIQLYEKVTQKDKPVKCKSSKRKAQLAPPADVKLLEIIFDGIHIAPLAVPRVTVTVQMLTPDYIEVLVHDRHTCNERLAGIELSVI